MNKLLSNLAIEGNLLKLIKRIFGKHTANMILKSERQNAFPQRLWKKQKGSILIFFIPHFTGVISECNKWINKDNNNNNHTGIQSQKKQVKLSFGDFLFVCFTDVVILYEGNPVKFILERN